MAGFHSSVLIQKLELKAQSSHLDVGSPWASPCSVLDDELEA